MAIATLKYNLDENHERLEFKRASNATGAYLVLHGFLETSLRSRIKYQQLSDETMEHLLKVREELLSLMNEHGVDLNDLE